MRPRNAIEVFRLYNSKRVFPLFFGKMFFFSPIWIIKFKKKKKTTSNIIQTPPLMPIIQEKTYLDYVIRILSVERLSLFEIGIGIVNLTILITIIVF